MLAPLPSNCSDALAQAANPAQAPLGTAARYGLLSGAALSATAPVVATGYTEGVGISANVQATNSLVAGGPWVMQALADLQTARNYAAGLAHQALSANPAGQTLTSGVYREQLVSATGQTVGACKIVVVH